MSKKKIAVAAAGILLVAGAAVAVSAPGHRGGWHGGDGMMQGDAFGGFGKRGWFGREMTKDAFEKRMRERFAGLDKNSDNVVDKAELEAALSARMSRHSGSHRGQGRGSRMLRGFDADRDGKVTKEEVRGEFERRFAEADINSDGKFDDADRPPMMRGRNGPDKAGFQMGRGHRGGMGMMGGMGFLRQADANNDGVVTKEEVATFADSVLARWDRNKDGVIDQADRDLLRKEMLDYRVQKAAHLMGAGSDGKVTREQFMAKAAARFARADANGDGTISRDEMPGRGFGRHGGRHHGARGEHGMKRHHDRAERMQGHGGPDAPANDGDEPAAKE